MLRRLIPILALLALSCGGVSRTVRSPAAWEAGKHDEAVTAYEAALIANPYDVPTYCRMGQALEDGGRIDEARDAFTYGFERLR